MSNQPEQIGRYKVIERVGRGAMGVLYRGIDPVLDREVAIKLMLLDFSDDQAQMRARFFREARAVAKLQHRNIVTVFEFAEEHNTPYIVMEFLNGTSLSARMASANPPSLEERLSMMVQLSEALHYAHQQGVVHRDVKPANIFLLSDGSIKLLDFGIAKVATSTLTRTSEVFGSVAYMSPEQVAGAANVDGRSDIFSAGVVLYELLARRKPFESPHATATIMKILHEPPPPLDDVSGLPRPLLAVVSRALEKKIENRYQTAGELAEALEGIRRALLSKDTAGPLEETRPDSDLEIRKYQQEMVEASTPAPAAEGFTPTVVASTQNRWVIPAGVAAVVLAGIVIGTLMLRDGNAPSSEIPSASPSPATATTGTPSKAVAPTPVAPAPAPTTAPPAATPAPSTATPSSKPASSTPAPESGRSATGRSRGSPAAAATNTGGTGGTSPSTNISPGGNTSPNPSGGTVAVSIRSTYPVEVLAGNRSLSAPGESHELRVDAGTTVRVRAPQYMLDASIKAEGRTLDYQAPAIGYVTVLTKYETCNVKISERDVGYPPITKLPIAAGQHRVDIACGTGPNPPGQLFNVLPNTIATVRIY